MKRIWSLLLIITSAAISLTAQKIERETTDRSQIIHLRTALNHLTVIELGEPVLQVATGSQSFKVEWRENKVFVQPTEADTSTNLFIWTASERLNYELERAGDVSAMDFAVDQAPQIQTIPAAKNAPSTEPSPSEILLAGKPVRRNTTKASRKPVEVTIRDLYEKNGRMIVRYSVCNRSNSAYELSSPQVYVLSGVRYPQSLYTLIGSQLGEQEAAHLKSKQQNPVPVLEGRVQAEHLAPGQESMGVVAVPAGTGSGPTVWRFQFGNQQGEQVTAFLVR